MSHAYLSPSSHARWSTCAGAPALEEGHADSSSKAAAWGTEAHALAAAALEGGRLPKHFTDQEMLDMVEGYVDYVRARQVMHEDAGAKNVRVHVEVKVPMAKVTSERGAHGTADVVIIASYSSGHVVDVIDLKTGREAVEVAHNGQLMSYALGAIDWLKTEGTLSEVNLIVYQPRLGPPQEWRPTLAELNAFRSATFAAGRLALSLKGRPEAAKHNLSPSPKACRWCRVKASCPAIQKVVEESLLKDFAPTDLGDKLAKADLADQWASAVREAALSKLLKGEDVPGYKLVQGRAGPRQWESEQQVKDFWAISGYPESSLYEEPKIKSPTAVEKMLGKTKFKDGALRTVQAEAKPQVALASDTRKPYDPRLGDFKNEDKS